MGNIRIKDIATTAASTASDDFVAIDGATNGTRKLNAYSPSFGGTLFLGTSTDSSNGKLQLATHTTSAGGIGFGTDISLYRTTANVVTLGAGNASGFYLRDTNSNTNLSQFYSDTGQTYFGTMTALPLIIRTNNTVALTLTSAQQVQVNASTASTSTSTGALVVSGGVGVAGAGYFGGTLNVSGVGGITLGTGVAGVLKAASDGDTSLQLFGSNTAFSGGYMLLNSASRSTEAGGVIFTHGNFNAAAPSSRFLVRYANNGAVTEQLRIDSSGQVAALATTDSSSTGTGALVVSGGLGVAKTITAGGVIVNKAYTVATLPAAASYTYGTCAVSDAINAAGTGLGISPTGGGSVKRLVYSDGSNWLLL